jgi:hypothetical protein
VRGPQQALLGVRRHWPLWLVVTAMWIYSLSSNVALLGQPVLDLATVYAPFSWLTTALRSAGRFDWPMHLTLIAVGVSACCALRSTRIARLILAAAVVMQAAELKRKRLDFHDVPLRRLSDPVCRFDSALVNSLGYEAYRRRLTFNSGQLARRGTDQADPCKWRASARSPLDDATIYVVDWKSRKSFRRRAICGAVDGLQVCVTGVRRTPLLQALRRNPV